MIPLALISILAVAQMFKFITLIYTDFSSEKVHIALYSNFELFVRQFDRESLIFENRTIENISVKTPFCRAMNDILFKYIEKYVPISGKEKEAIASINIIRAIPKGQILLAEGEKCDVGFFVLRGCIRTYLIKEGEEKTTDFFTEMDLLTPQCTFDDSPSDIYIGAIEDSIICVGDSTTEEELTKAFPAYPIMCRKVMDEIVAKQKIEMNHYKTSTPEERYLALCKTRPDLIQRVSQNQLASYLGVTPQSLSRIRARLVKNRQQLNGFNLS